MRTARLAFAAIIAASALTAGPAVAATPSLGGSISSAPINTTVGTTQGIIMRDGGVCDPIRHMGC
jgi:hypothetical protein